MLSRILDKDHFTYSLVGICFFSFLCQILFNAYAIYSVDDFWFAHRIFQFKDGLPYRDFAPYKTVLGYYVLLIPMLLVKGTWGSLFLTKNFIALINSTVLFFASKQLSKYVSKTSVLISLFLLCFSDLFISYSSHIRVDLLGYWFGLFAFLVLLENRYILAGILMGVGFCCSQKVIWYIAAGNVALFVFFAQQYKDKDYLMNIVRFNVACAGVITAYILFWSWIGGFTTVFSSVFQEAAAMYRLTWYNNARGLFWQQIILYNPLLVLLWPFTAIAVLITFRKDPNYKTRLFIISISLTILACLIPYKQIFPYYMQVTYPIFLLTSAVFIDWTITLFTQRHALIFAINPFLSGCLFAFYILNLAYTQALLDLPISFLSFSLIPLILIYYLAYNKKFNAHTTTSYYHFLILAFIFLGIIFPLTLYVVKLSKISGRYQRATLHAVTTLTQDGSEYVAGIELLHDKNQPIPGMRHLMGPAIAYLYKPTPELEAVMLPSLYEDPNATMTSVINNFKKSRVKFIVNNYRMNALPDTIKKYLNSQYEHFWGSIYIYSPHIPAGTQRFTIKFTGDYYIQTLKQSIILLNDNQYHTQRRIKLKAGNYTSQSIVDFRLRLLPPNSDEFVIPELDKDDWDLVIA